MTNLLGLKAEAAGKNFIRPNHFSLTHKGPHDANIGLNSALASQHAG